MVGRHRQHSIAKQPVSSQFQMGFYVVSPTCKPLFVKWHIAQGPIQGEVSHTHTKVCIGQKVCTKNQTEENTIRRKWRNTPLPPNPHHLR
jgi:putative methionine-R-sulfoxide reductase with GAF domain